MACHQYDFFSPHVNKYKVNFLLPEKCLHEAYHEKIVLLFYLYLDHTPMVTFTFYFLVVCKIIWKWSFPNITNIIISLFQFCHSLYTNTYILFNAFRYGLILPSKNKAQTQALNVRKLNPLLDSDDELEQDEECPLNWVEASLKVRFSNNWEKEEKEGGEVKKKLRKTKKED